MKLTDLFESEDFVSNLLKGVGTSIFKKGADPNNPELLGTKGGPIPYRSGNQNTALTKEKYRKFFNAPSDQKHLKVRDGDPKFKSKPTVRKKTKKPSTKDPLNPART